MINMPFVILISLFLVGCTNQKTGFHEHGLVEFGSVKLDQLNYETPELRDLVSSLPQSEEPEGPREMVGWYCGGSVHIKEVPDTTKFRIVRVTEEFVPLTGERKALVYHVKMSPFDP